eukprot:g2891.t1
MFSLIYGFVQKCTERPELKVLIVGLDHAGKTTLLEQMKSLHLQKGDGGVRKNGRRIKQIGPTVGMNVGKVSHKKWDILFWDLGGHKSMREIWEHYYEEASAIMFVIDAADPRRVPEAEKELRRLVGDKRLAGIPILLAANKQDLSAACEPQSIAKLVGAHNIHSRAFQTLGVSALTCEGLKEGVDWLVKASVTSDTAGRAPPPLKR